MLSLDVLFYHYIIHSFIISFSFSFIHSFISLLIHSMFVHEFNFQSFINSFFIHSFIHLFIISFHSFVRAIIYAFIHPPIYTFVPLFIHSPVCSLIKQYFTPPFSIRVSHSAFVIFVSFRRLPTVTSVSFSVQLSHPCIGLHADIVFVPIARLFIPNQFSCRLLLVSAVWVSVSFVALQPHS